MFISKRPPPEKLNLLNRRCTCIGKHIISEPCLIHVEATPIWSYRMFSVNSEKRCALRTGNPPPLPMNICLSRYDHSLDHGLIAHYENLPIQYMESFLAVKIENSARKILILCPPSKGVGDILFLVWIPSASASAVSA